MAQLRFAAAVAAAGSFVLGACVPGGQERPPRPLLSTMAAEAKPRGDAERPAILPASASPITFERMSRYPEPGWQVPRLVQFSPDGKLVTFLQSEGQSEQMALWAFDRATK